MADEQGDLRLYWCHRCMRDVQLPAGVQEGEMIRCPHCNTGFIEELDNEADHSASSLGSLQEPDVPAGSNDPHGRDRDAAARLQQESSGQVVQHVLWVDPVTGILTLRDLRSGEEQQMEETQGLELLLRLLLNGSADPEGTPPAEKEAVEALPTVRVAGGLSCAVCLEEMEAGSKAKEMPCRHRFHGECLLPWLEIHGTCPVCRLELKVGASSSGGERDSREGHRHGRRHRLLAWLSALLSRRSRRRRSTGGMSPATPG